MITKEREILLNELMDILGYKFKNLDILNLAFIHRSYINEYKEIKISNERLEFLGDVVLGFIVTTELYKYFNEFDEGYLTKLRSKIVCEDSFSYGAKFFDLGKYLLLGKGEDNFEGRNRNSILSDTFEALFGALYIDAGIEITSKIVKKHFFDLVIKKINENIFIKDYKSYLQEYFQKKSVSKINYYLLSESGPDHEKEFNMCIKVDDKIIGCGKGKNKKQAEQNAAKSALIKLGEISE